MELQVGSAPRKPDGLRRRQGRLPKGDSGEGETGSDWDAETQPGLGPGTRFQPVDRIAHCAGAMAQGSCGYSGLPRPQNPGPAFVGGAEATDSHPSSRSSFSRSWLGLKNSPH